MLNEIKASEVQKGKVRRILMVPDWVGRFLRSNGAATICNRIAKEHCRSLRVFIQ